MTEKFSSLWQLGTRLIPDEEIDSRAGRGYVPNLPGSNVYFESGVSRDITLAVDNPLYLNCAYAELDKWLNRTYQGQCCGHSFFYRLQRSYTFIEEIEHEFLAKVAALYEINRPLIFAPEARRAVDICITDGLSADELAIPSTNGKFLIDSAALAAHGWQIDLLQGKLRTNQRLIMTNVQISDKTHEFSNDGEDEHGIRYFDVKETLPPRTLIIPNTPSLKETVRKIVADKNNFRVYVNDEADLRNYNTITFGEPQPNDWVNWQHTAVDMPRLRTAGDVDDFCRRFVDVERGYNCHFFCVKQPKDRAPENVIRRYAQRDRYPDRGQTQELFHARRYRPICYLSFSGEGNYLGDWAEYVLEACEYEYPEFSWAGVTDET